ncbi:PTS N,N'-diacetylchitobiose transporter subunit IIA [Escherichia coli]|nr:PTS N,N'-diacetylchitobiose transporter subunit IIA [Escherichia coli]
MPVRVIVPVRIEERYDGSDNIPDTQTEAEELEEVVMGLIINSGQARSLAYAALKQAKQGDFAAAKAMMDQSRIALNEAHLVQTKLIEGDAGEGKMKVSLVLVHAQDHLMTSMLARELITELSFMKTEGGSR